MPTEPVPLWRNIAVTKFRAPMGQAALVPRQGLIDRLHASISENQIVLISAPGGSGKTMLIAQTLHAHHLVPASRSTEDQATEYIWLTLDDGDNDVNRLLVVMLRALQDVRLEWDIAPEVIASHAVVSDAQTQAVAAAIVNALCSYGGERLVMVLDDLQRVSDPEALGFLSTLIEAMPPEVCVVIASRVLPDLPLARWRIKRGLQEFSAQDLGVIRQEALALAEERGVQLDSMEMERMLQRSGAWLAGFRMMLSVCEQAPQGALPHGINESGNPQLFDYFADEILNELPEALRSFVLECSILHDLTPERCAAVTGSSETHAFLQALLRRSLFITVLDDRTPVLRFHDLFLEFLRNTLRQAPAEKLRALHARAAAAEPDPARAVSHWLAAQDWAQAVRTMLAASRELLEQGSAASLLRWIAGLPQAMQDSDPDVLFMRALCVLQRWNFPDAILLLEQALQSYADQGAQAQALQCTLMLPRICDSVGYREKSQRYIDLIEVDALPVFARVIHESSLFWHGQLCDLASCAAPLAFVASAVEQAPALLLPATENLFVGLHYGIPGTLDSLRRIQRASQAALANGASHWQIEANASMPWPEIWRGEREAVEAALRKNDEMARRLGPVVFNVRINRQHAEFIVAIFKGDAELAERRAVEASESFLSMASGMAMSWMRINLHLVSHAHWIAGDLKQLDLAWAQLGDPGTGVEWPAIDTLREQLRGRRAYLRGDFAEAEAAFTAAMQRQQVSYLPMYCGDCRFSLVMTWLMQGRQEMAMSLMSQRMESMLTEDSVGALLMEPPAFRQALLEALPEPMQRRMDVQRLRSRVQAWCGRQSDASAEACGNDLLGSLSQRELAVLVRIASGDSNKMIAQRFALSTHTVKSHVASILTKLGCVSRGQAAALWRDGRRQA